MVRRSLKRFLPPVFDPEAYREEIRTWSYYEWWEALVIRKFAIGSLETYEYADPGITSGPGSREFCEQELRGTLPHLFEKRKLSEGASAFSSQRPIVDDLTVERAIELYEQIRKSPAILPIIEDPKHSNYGAFQDRAAHPVFWESRDAWYRERWSREFLVQVDLHASNRELEEAFKAWLERARTAYQIPEPRPRVLRREGPNLVLEKKRFGDWREKQVIAFLDLYVWNRLYNPPPEPTLWRRRRNSWMSYGGEQWTVNRPEWVEMLGLPRDIGETSFGKNVCRRAFGLLENDMLDRLELHAYAEQVKESGPDSDPFSVRT